MRTVRTAALSRHRAPAFVMASGLELIQLRKLSWVARVLFFELLALADHATGRISTSYAVLAALLDVDQAPTAHTHDAPTLKRLRVALASLESVGLVRSDPIANEKKKALVLRVSPRGGIGTPSENQGRQRGRPERAKKQAPTTPYAQTGPVEGQTEGQGVQENNSPPTPSVSTGPADARRALQAVAAELRAGGNKRAPKGA